MRSCSIFRILLPAAFLLSSFPTLAHAAVQDRIASSVNSSSRVPLQGTVSGRAKRSTDLGAAPANQKLESLSLRFSMTAAQQADLTQLSAAQLSPGSPQYHQWLTPEQFGTRFGLSSGDLAKVSSWLTSQGFSVNSVARSSTFISFSGTVAQAQQAFGTTIHKVSYNGEQHISNLTDPVLPSAIAGVVTGITGLDDFKAKPHSRSRNGTTSTTQPLYTQTSNGTTSHYISPADLYTIYNFPPSSSNITGTGITIAVMGQTEIIAADITAFQTAAGLPSKAPTQQYVATTTYPTGASLGISPGDVDEAHIDNEWSNAAAPGASILYVYGPDVFAQSLTYAIDNKVAPIITVSYGLCETGFGASTLTSYNQLFQQANVEGITVIAAAGDAGATDCDATGIATEGLAVDFPGSSPYVVSAGGSMFSGDASTPGNYWSSNNSTTAPLGGSALSYIPEQPWNETTAAAGLGDGSGNGGGAGGGGASAYFAKPSWQQGTGGAGSTPNDGSRDVPDFSLNAAAQHDGYLVCTSGSGSSDLPCTNGFLTSNGQPNVFGGTSFVAPTFAGILARIEQSLGSAASGGLGNIGPVLYGLANGPTYSTIFHDIATGNNSVPCSQGTLNCPNGGSIGFNAGTGYDQASGLGSLNVASLVSGWSTATPTGISGTGCNPSSPTTGTASCISTTTLTTTATVLCGINNGTVALSAAVAGSIPGTAPTGTVQFLVDNVAVGAATLSSGVATYSLVTSSLASGGHTVSAVYLGDGNYSGSKGTLLQGASQSGIEIISGTPVALYPNGAIASVDVVSSSKPDFSITPCTAPISVNPGATATGVSFTVTPFNGFTGAVKLSVTNNDGMAATTSFSVTPVNITSSAGVTTSFVITASQASTTAAAVKAKFNSGQHSSGRAPWYAAGSGATLACMLLVTLPRRRRWGALLAVMLSLAAFTAVGCSNTSTTGSSSGTNPTNPATPTPATAGTYSFVVTAVSGSLVHSTFVTVTVP